MHPSPPPENSAEPPADEVLTAPLRRSRSTGFGLPCPVDRLPGRRRNQICITIIALGLANYLVYTLTYAALGGDAHNGHRQVVHRADGSTEASYYVRGHHLDSLTGREHAVSRGAWVYSYLHSISVPLTWGAVLISMLVLARPHILATMRGGWISGQVFVTVFGTIVILISSAATVLFTWHFVVELSRG